MKNKLKTTLINLSLVGLSGLAIVLAIVGCDNQEAKANSESNIKEYTTTDVTGYISIHEIVDEESGVHYLIANKNGQGVSVTPMYNADGSLKVD